MRGLGWGLIAVTLLGPGACAQPSHPWQVLQMPSAAEVARGWKEPPAEYGPEPYYGMDGAATRESVGRDFDTAVRLGFHAVTWQAGSGNTQSYLSPEYFDFFKTVVVEEAKKRGLRLWIVDDAGYPSGFAGGLISSLKPELRMQALSVAQTLQVKGGETFKQAVGPDVVAVTAASVAGDQVAVPVAGGALNWTAPGGGDWTVTLVAHGFRTSPTNSATNPLKKKDQTQSLEDYMDPAATMAWIQLTHEGYYKAAPEEFGKTILGFRGDEPDYSIPGLPWTPKFFERFEQLKGYDVRPYLASMLGVRGAAQAKPSAAKADYYDVFSQMFRDGFFKVQGEWCAAHGVEYQVHLNHEEMEMQLVRSEGDFMRDMKYVQVPGIDAIWHQIWTDTISDFPRLASSAAHVYGHPRSFTESFAAFRPQPDLSISRYVLNEQFVRGVNLVEAMFFDASSANAEHKPRLSGAMSDPGWPALMEYARRLSYAMAMGRPAAEVALYLPSSSMWLGDAGSDQAFVSAERLLSERQIDFDIVGLEALATDLKAGPGTFETLSGNRYKTVILPSLAVLSQAELDRLREFARGGGQVLFLGRTPGLISGRTFLDARKATAADFAGAKVVPGDLPPVPTPPAQPPAAAPEKMVVPHEMDAAVAAAVGPRAVTLDTPDAALKVTTRRWKDADVYLFFNEGADTAAHTVMLRTAGKTVAAWDPATGTITAVKATPVHGGLRVPLTLKGYETALLVVQ